MPVEITNARFNLLAGEAFFEHFGAAPRSVPERFWLPADYGAIFGQLRGGAGSTRYAMPWRSSQRNTFWKAYCEQTPATQISTDLAIRLMVPLRLVPGSVPIISVSGGAERVYCDVFGFPHGLVAALTIQTSAKPTLSIDQWRDRLRELRLEPVFAVTLPGTAPAVGVTAADMFETVLRWFRDEYFGPIAVASPSEAPFSIASVIQATGVDPETPLASLSGLQQSLNAVTAWPINWEAATLPPLDQAVLPASASLNPSAGDALYAARRGRVLWRPALFTYQSRATHRLHTLSCLSHNLLAASIQAESLRLFAIRFAALSPSEQAAIPPFLAPRAATLISRLWHGDQTYRSSSVKRQLGDPASLAQVNALLASQQLQPIG